MEEHILTDEGLEAFKQHLKEEEYGAATIEKYLRELQGFQRWLGERGVSKETAAGFKTYLQGEGLAPVTINSKLSTLNVFFRFAGWEECRVRFLRIQRQLFRNPSKELTREEYERLLKTAREKGKERLALLMETVCGTGIRVSEVAYITMEAARQGRAQVDLKGKIRVIFLPDRLCRKLLKYGKAQGIDSGEIFLTGSGQRLSRRQIWREMKGLCESAKVEADNVFPHNLRHLFATAFYKISRDIVKLADILGHSSIETTRIYLKTAGEEHTRYLDQMKLVT